MRRVLLGETPQRAALTSRATERLTGLRDEFSGRVDAERTVVASDGDRVRWWTFAGARANAVLTAGLARAAPALLDEGSPSNLHLSLAGGTTAAQLQVALAQVRWIGGERLSQIEPEVSQTALRKLKFSELLHRSWPSPPLRHVRQTIPEPLPSPSCQSRSRRSRERDWLRLDLQPGRRPRRRENVLPQGAHLNTRKGVLTTISDARS